MLGGGSEGPGGRGPGGKYQSKRRITWLLNVQLQLQCPLYIADVQKHFALHYFVLSFEYHQ